MRIDPQGQSESPPAYWVDGEDASGSPTELGAQEVENLIGQLEYGVFL
jgi:hypothetical protein